MLEGKGYFTSFCQMSSRAERLLYRGGIEGNIWEWGDWGGGGKFKSRLFTHSR